MHLTLDVVDGLLRFRLRHTGLLRELSNRLLPTSGPIMPEDGRGHVADRVADRGCNFPVSFRVNARNA